MQVNTSQAIDWTEQGLFPDLVTRYGIRYLLKSRLFEIRSDDPEHAAMDKCCFIEMMNQSPIAIQTNKANEQHYELPAEFFEYVLGAHRKYSCCYWGHEEKTLDDAEEKALKITCERADLKNGHYILELGCGWGSLSLFMAQQYPDSQIVSVSNSKSQRDYISRLATARNLNNLNIITADLNDFMNDRKFDRIVSVEMFEHMRNYRELFNRISNWLITGGYFFMHIFCHRDIPYEFEDRDQTDWMSRYFFSGGMMPSDDLPLFFQENLQIRRYWRWNGQHYEKTANEWLKNMDDNEHESRQILADLYGSEQEQVWWRRWRLFFMACAELFGFNGGREWFVSHYLFEKPEVKS